MRILFLILSLFIAPSFIIGQVIEVPLKTNPVLESLSKKKIRPVENKNPTNFLTLPFVDDFSENIGYPNPDLWQDNDVYINRTISGQSPTIGVATFDGLNASGRAYNELSITHGGADTLTSQPIDLGSLTAADQVGLSFFLQPKGFGDKPEFEDSIVVEFLNSNMVWEQRFVVNGIAAFIPSDSVPQFGNQYFLSVNQTQFLHSDFQFRFRNYATLTGNVDHWNLDYVRLDKDRIPDTQTFNDIGFSGNPSPFMNNYRVIPWSHFVDDISDALPEVNLEYELPIRNFFGNSVNLNNLNYTVTEINSGTTVLTKNLGTNSVSPNNFATFDDSQNFNNFTIGGTIQGLDKATFVTNYSFTADGQTAVPGPYNVAAGNDQVTRSVTFDNYFAYDDGTAESNIIATSSGTVATQIVTQFKSFKADSLRAIQIHHQWIAGDLSFETLFFKLYVGALDNNSFVPLTPSSGNVEYVDSLNGFYTYILDHPVGLGNDELFYIGWQPLLGSDPIPIGMDKNNPNASAFNFFSTDGGQNWANLPESVSGGIMIRPVVGGPLLTQTKPEPQEISLIADVFPNPVQDELIINLYNQQYADYSYELFSVLGQKIAQGNLKQRLNTTQLASGNYVLRVNSLDGSNSFSHLFNKL